MIPRDAAGTVRELAARFKVVAIVGPRQSGKSTLARVVFSHNPYVTLEDPDQASFARMDPRRFLGGYPERAVLDEVQRTPELLSYPRALWIHAA
jgi:predicted AAA+ superfamily ATPase